MIIQGMMCMFYKTESIDSTENGRKEESEIWEIHRFNI
jgi:hypothetical protein